MSARKTAIIIQARMTSTRLPGKILMDLAGRPMLEFQIERLRRCAKIDEIVVATTVNREDDSVVGLCESLGVHVHRGPEDDVLTRYLEAAEKYGTTDIVRSTADCPLIDPAIVDRMVELYLSASPEVDYAANLRTYPHGQDVEVFSLAALKTVSELASESYQREHVTPLFYELDRFRRKYLDLPVSHRNARWTVDTPADLEFVKAVVNRLLPSRPKFGIDDIFSVLRREPDLAKINGDVAQKPLKG